MPIVGTAVSRPEELVLCCLRLCCSEQAGWLGLSQLLGRVAGHIITLCRCCVGGIHRFLPLFLIHVVFLSSAANWFGDLGWGWMDPRGLRGRCYGGVSTGAGGSSPCSAFGVLDFQAHFIVAVISGLLYTAESDFECDKVDCLV
jgi:hypothetical protein